jgi:hypothetical protein
VAKQLAALVRQVQQDGGGLEQGDAGGAVDQHRNATVRVERKKLGPLVLALIDAHMAQAVGQAHFFQGDGDLEAVWRTVGVENQIRSGHRAHTSGRLMLVAWCGCHASE